MNCTECQKEITGLEQECCEHNCKRCKAELCEDCGISFDNQVLVCKECSQFYTKEGSAIEE